MVSTFVSLAASLVSSCHHYLLRVAWNRFRKRNFPRCWKIGESRTGLHGLWGDVEPGRSIACSVLDPRFPVRPLGASRRHSRWRDWWVFDVVSGGASFFLTPSPYSNSTVLHFFCFSRFFCALSFLRP